MSKYPERWTKKSQAAGGPKKAKPEYPRFDAFAQGVAALVFLLWLLAVRDSPYLVGGPATATYKLAPVWLEIYWPTVLLTFASMVLGCINLFRPDWKKAYVRLAAGQSIDLTATE